MAAVSNIPKDLQDSIRDVLDRRVKVSVKRLVKMEAKDTKFSTRVLAFSPCRLFILTTKVPTRLEHSFHFLEIQGIESKKCGQLTIIVDGKDYKFLSVEAGSEELDHMIIHLGISLKQIFPSFPLERLIVKVDIQPEERLKTMQEMIKNMEGKEVGPCGAFTTMYQCMCDFHNLPFRDEVAWDIDTIYLSHDSRELRLQDFDHLHSKDLVPIISALEHNTWFKSLNASNVRLAPEACNEITKVMRRNAILEEVNLSNTGIKADFVQKLATALISNSGSQLQRIDLSNNMLDDKSVISLLGAMKILPCGVSSLDLSKTGLSTRCINKLGEIFSQSPAIPPAITSLNLSDNGLRGEDFPMLYNFLAQPNSITVLDLSSTDCVMDALCDPLLRGCPSLTTLKLSRTTFSHKRSKEPVIPHSWKQLFASTCFLESVDLSNCRLPAEALKELLMGIASNRNMKELILDISSNDLGPQGISVLASCIPEIKNLKGLDISNNGFDSDLRVLLPELSKNSYLKRLSIGRNFSNIKLRYMQEIMTALVQLIQNDSSNLEYLSITDSRLKMDTSYIINALGSNDSLIELDISGNAIGDHGARMLAKALQINTKLRKVVWDKNNINAQGFEDVAEAMKKNMTMKQMPFPVNDAIASMKLLPERTEAALLKIESFLQRNHCPRRFAPDQAYRLQQGFLISSTQQILDRKVVQVQDTINALNSLGSMDVYADDVAAAENLLKDAEKSRQLLPRLQDIALSSQSAGNPVDEKLKESKNSLHDTVVEHLKKTLEEMLTCTSSTCPAVMTNQKFETELKEGCQFRLVTRKDFMQGMLEGANADIYNHLGEINLAVASLISDNVVDEVIDTLAATYKTLSNHLNLRRSGAYKENEDEADVTATSKCLFPEKASPKPADKRKSMMNRKTRPQSTLDRDRIKRRFSADNQLADKKEVDGLSRPQLEGPEALSQPLSNTADNERLPQISSANEPSDSIGFDQLPDLPVQSLQHVVKSRPRRVKVNRPTIPVPEGGSRDSDPAFGTDNGPHPMYSSPPTISVTPSGAASNSGRKASKDDSHSSTKGEKSSSLKEENSGKTEGKSESKKWSPMSLIKGKPKEEKAEKEKDKDSKKSHSFSNFFKKSHDKKRPSVTENPIPETSSSVKEANNVKQEADMTDKSLEPSKEDSRRTSTTSSSSGEKLNVEAADKAAKEETEKPDKTIPVRPPREKRNAEKVALLPQLPKKDVKIPTLAKEEDVSLSDKESDSKEEEKSTSEANDAEKKEEKAAGPKLPPGVANMGGLAALGSRNLLDQLKERQVKRSSHIPTTATSEEELKKEEQVQPKEKSSTSNTTETNNNNNNNNNKANESAKTSTTIPDKSQTTDNVKVSEESETLSLPSGNEEKVKKEASPSPPQKSSPTSTPKFPSPAPRVARRPVSTSVVESSSSASSLTSSGEVEQKEGDRDSKGPIARPRPPPPLKPRPPLAPRPRKSDDSTDSTTSLPAPCPDEDQAVNTENASPADGESESKVEKGNSEIVYDSATLRLSVKDKIKRMSQSTVAKPTGPLPVKLAKEKAMSLPKDSKLPEEGEGEDAQTEDLPDENQDLPIPKTPTVIPPSPVSTDEAVSPTMDNEGGSQGVEPEGDKVSAESQPPAEEEGGEEPEAAAKGESAKGEDVIMV